MSAAPAVLMRVLRQPLETLELDAAQWDLLVRQARAARLLEHLAQRLHRHALLADVPAAPRRHLRAALQQAAQQREGLLRTLGRAAEALAVRGTPFLLQGAAASLGAGWPDALCRLDDAPQLSARPASTQHQPLWHAAQPLASLGAVDGMAVLALPGSARAAAIARLGHVPASADAVLQAALRLWQCRQPGLLLRELVALDALLRHFGALPGFWPALVSRAERRRLQRPLMQALLLATQQLQTPQPAAAARALSRHLPGPLRLRLHQWLWTHSLLPALPDDDDARRRAARRLLRWLPRGGADAGTSAPPEAPSRKTWSVA